MGTNGKYGDLVLEERDGVLGHRSLLGLELCLEGERLYYFDPANDVRLLTPAEERDARHKEKEARENAEAERDLEARLRRQETAARQAAELERDQEIRLRREETASRRAAEARIAELERQLGAQ